MIFKIQSLVDVITNSSTSIYQIASKSSIDYMKTVINGILIAVGSDKKADDLFNFRIKEGSDYLGEYKDYLYEQGYISEDIFLSDITDPDELFDCSIKKYSYKDYLQDHNIYTDSYITVTTKDDNKEADKLLGKIYSIYSHEAFYE